VVGRALRDVAAEEALDHMERTVDPGREASGGDVR
jgi:hypothetical protein